MPNAYVGIHLFGTVQHQTSVAGGRDY